MDISKLDSTGLEQKALELRRMALKIIFEAGSGHPGGSLAATDPRLTRVMV